MDHAIFFFRITDESAAVGLDGFDSGEDVITLKGEPGPCPLPFPTAVDAKCRSAEGEFTPDFHFELELGAEGFLIKFNRPKVVGSPKGIFDF